MLNFFTFLFCIPRSMVKIRCGKNEAYNFLSNEEIQRNASIDKSVRSKTGDWFDALQFEEKHFQDLSKNQSGEDGKKGHSYQFHVKCAIAHLPPKKHSCALKIVLAH